MRVREIDSEILKKARRRLRMYGEQKIASEATGIHRNMISQFANNRKTATDPVATKFENYIRSL